jgi:hypothetical protein
MRTRYFPPALVLLFLLPPVSAQAPVRTRVEIEVVSALDGAPLADTRVRVATCGGEREYAKTDAQGRLARTSAGELPCTQVDVNRAGWRRQGGSGGYIAPLVLDARAIQSPAGVKVSRSEAADGVRQVRVRFALEPAPVLTGRVTDGNGTPLAGCYVQVGSAKGQSAQLRTDDRGEYRTARLEPGTYTIAASQCRPMSMWDGAFRPTYYPKGLRAESARPVELAAGVTTRADVQIALVEGVTVSGRLSGALAQTPVSFARLMLLSVPMNGENGASWYNTAGGTFELPNVLPGTYYLFGYTKPLAVGGSGLDTSKPVLAGVREVRVGEQGLTGADLELQPVADLPGQLRFAEGCEPSPLRLRLMPRYLFEQVPLEVAVDASGTFALSGDIVGVTGLAVEPVSAGARPVLSAVHLGERALGAREPLVLPAAGGQTLKLTVGCREPGRRAK